MRFKVDRRIVSMHMILGILIFGAGHTGLLARDRLTISESDLREKIEGYWIGQLVGNYMGFPFEWMYFEEACPVLVDRYYNVANIPEGLKINRDRRGHVQILCETMGGAWTDDDTDIEFVTLHAVEKYGLDITYPEIGEAWKTHINRFIWGSNQRARLLMDEGLVPPATGSKKHNPYWMQIDPQLVNEIWSVFYPGMVDKAVERADWGAHITNDDWGTHPTRFYAALYSAAFVEDDIATLYDIGIRALPEGSPFLPGLQDVKRWHSEYPDWRNTRDLIYRKYYKYPEDVDPHNDVSVIINGLFGAMAILYGEGDFIKTTGIAVSAGLDCDNQAATCAGFIGVLKGSGAIPEHLTTDTGAGKLWEKPFNNTYVNFSRDHLPNVTPIDEIVDRIMAVAVTAIMENGGERIEREGKVYYLISEQ